MFLMLGRNTVNMQRRAGKQPNSVKGRTVCNIVWAMNPQLIFLGHLSAGSYFHCSNLSAYYVTHWPTLPCTLSVIFHSAYVFHGLPMNAGETDRIWSRHFSVKVLSVQMKQHEEQASQQCQSLTLSIFSFCILHFHFIHRLAAFTVLIWTTL